MTSSRWFAALALIVVLGGCTAQERARRFGGTMTETLPAGQKLVVATWKESQLWFLLRSWRAGDVAETYTFRESSAWGLVEGTVIIHEQAPK